MIQRKIWVKVSRPSTTKKNVHACQEERVEGSPLNRETSSIRLLRQPPDAKFSSLETLGPYNYGFMAQGKQFTSIGVGAMKKVNKNLCPKISVLNALRKNELKT